MKVYCILSIFVLTILGDSATQCVDGAQKPEIKVLSKEQEGWKRIEGKIVSPYPKAEWPLGGFVNTHGTKLVKTSTPPLLDGHIDDECWELAVTSGQFMFGESGETVFPGTSAKFVFDDNNIYVAFECADPEMDRLAAEHNLHDSEVYKDDHVFLSIAPLKHGTGSAFYHSNLRRPDPLYVNEFKPAKEDYHYPGYSYYLAVNPDGTTLDAYYDPYDDGYYYVDRDLNAVTSTRKGATGWTVELSVPIRSFGVRMDPGTIWSVSVGRMRPAKNNLPQVVSTAPAHFVFQNDSLRTHTAFSNYYESHSQNLTAFPPPEGPVSRPEIAIRKAKSPPLIDGQLDEEAWRSAAVIENFRDNESGMMLSGEEGTEALLCYDDDYLYVSFRCQKSMNEKLSFAGVEWLESEKLRGYVGDWLVRRAKWDIVKYKERYPRWGDHIEFAFTPGYMHDDPYHLGSYEILVNYRGDILDRHHDAFGMNYFKDVSEKSVADVWDSHAKVGTSEQNDSWIVEMAIPLSRIDIGRNPLTTWRMNFSRERPARVDASGQFSSWSPTYSYGNFYNPDRYGTVTDFTPDWETIRQTRMVDKIAALEPTAASMQKRLTQEPEPTGLSTDAEVLMGSALETMTHLKMQTSSTTTGGIGDAYLRMEQLERDINLVQKRLEYRPVERSHTNRRYHDVCFVNKTHGWAVGGMGTIVHTDNGGETWALQNTPTEYILQSITFINENEGWAVGGWVGDPLTTCIGDKGIILHTGNGGEDWTVQYEGGRWLYDLTFTDALHGWAVGAFGVVMRTANGGRDWELCTNSGTHRWLSGIDFVDAQYGWAVGEDETIIHTTDGGKNWQKQEGKPWDRPLGNLSYYRSVTFLDRNEGWIVGRNGAILHTTDGGAHWVAGHSGLDEKLGPILDFEEVCFPDALHGSIVGTLGNIVLTTRDGGLNWNRYQTGHPGYLYGVSFVDNDHGWAVGERGAVLATVDGGMHWTVQQNGGTKVDVAYMPSHQHHLPKGVPGYLEDTGHNFLYVVGTTGGLPYGRLGFPQEQSAEIASNIEGISVFHLVNDFMGGEGVVADFVNYVYQLWHGYDPMVRQMVVEMRTWRPDVIITDTPITGEGYNKSCTKMTARSVYRAFDMAGEPDQFPELTRIGLPPWQPKKLYHTQGRLAPEAEISVREGYREDKFSSLLGMTYNQAAYRHKYAFQGALDRSVGYAPKGGARWGLMLVKSLVPVTVEEISIFDGLE
jgi:photosystem II stability/assembly factor-like uncharacterized protein